VIRKDKENLFARLLACPDFDFRPHLDEAVIDWLDKHLSTFLKENPNACRFFVNSGDHARDVATALPLESEHLPVFIKKLGTFENWNSRWAYEELSARLSEAGLTEMLLDCDNFYTSGNKGKAIAALSPEGIARVIDRIKTQGLKSIKWQSEPWLELVKKMAGDQLDVLFQPELLNIGYMPAQRVISTLAQRVPFNKLPTLTTMFFSHFAELQCMKCRHHGEAKVMKSKPGYTLHRKVCDSQNEFPNIWTTLAVRMREKI
jgi:hypothetical protein